MHSMSIIMNSYRVSVERVREIRSDTMHLDPKGVDVDDRKELRDFAGLLKQVKQLG